MVPFRHARGSLGTGRRDARFSRQDLDAAGHKVGEVERTRQLQGALRRAYPITSPPMPWGNHAMQQSMSQGCRITRKIHDRQEERDEVIAKRNALSVVFDPVQILAVALLVEALRQDGSVEAVAFPLGARRADEHSPVHPRHRFTRGRARLPFDEEPDGHHAEPVSARGEPHEVPLGEQRPQRIHQPTKIEPSRHPVTVAATWRCDNGQ